MRRGFLAVVFAFGFVASTAIAVYVRVALDRSWLDVLKAWLLLFGCLTLLPLGYGWTQLVGTAFWGWLFPRRVGGSRPPPGPGRPTGPR